MVEVSLRLRLSALQFTSRLRTFRCLGVATGLRLVELLAFGVKVVADFMLQLRVHVLSLLFDQVPGHEGKVIILLWVGAPLLVRHVALLVVSGVLLIHLQVEQLLFCFLQVQVSPTFVDVLTVGLLDKALVFPALRVLLVKGVQVRFQKVLAR